MSHTTFSKGRPFFSYRAIRKKGSMRTIVHMDAALLPRKFFRKKNAGTPISAPAPKQINFRFVKLNSTLVFTLVRSFGIGT